MRLSLEEERFLVEWCLSEEAARRPPSKARIKRIGEIILKEAGDFTPLGYRWPDRFLQRHTRVKTKKGVLLDTERKRGSTRAAYEDFYARLRHQINTKDIPPSRITNIDEHGMQEGETEAGTVIGDSLTPKALVTSSKGTT